MVGRAALGNPWIFGGRSVARVEAAQFLVDYANALRASGGAGERGAAARVKQLLRHWTAGDLLRGRREEWLSETDSGALLDRLSEIARGQDAVASGAGPIPYEALE
jgi:tRNA-dihydrouridine synthase